MEMRHGRQGDARYRGGSLEVCKRQKVRRRYVVGRKLEGREGWDGRGSVRSGRWRWQIGTGSTRSASWQQEGKRRDSMSERQGDICVAYAFLRKPKQSVQGRSQKGDERVGSEHPAASGRRDDEMRRELFPSAHQPLPVISATGPGAADDMMCV